MVLGFDFGGASLAAGEGTLVSLTFIPSVSGGTMSVADVVATGAGGSALGVTGPEDAEVPGCANNDGDDLCNVADDCADDAENDDKRSTMAGGAP